MRNNLALPAKPAEPAAPFTTGRIAFLSTVPPQRCGLATFNADLMAAVRGSAPGLRCEALGVGDGAAIGTQDRAGYRRAGAALAASGTDLLCVQHEYGIFGGPDGDMLLDLLDAAGRVPVVATLHTVLDHPSEGQRRVMEALLARTTRAVVMTERSARVLRRVHGVAADRMEVIPHGIPAATGRVRAACRAALGWGQRPTLLTFGLLSPGKGIEHAVRALPALARQWPDLLYVVIGATHPNLLRAEGERYRDGLAAQAQALGVGDNLRLVNRYADVAELLDALAAADIYLTPYNNEDQSVSGTLSYSYGLGTPVVSTPYHHAAELLAGGRGVLVPFADGDAIADAVAGLLSDPARLAALRAAARREGEAMRWPAIGQRYQRLFGQVLLAAAVRS